MSTGPAFKWFAWHPVWTEDRGWRWLRLVTRRRFYLDLDGHPAMSWWIHSVVMGRGRARLGMPTPATQGDEGMTITEFLLARIAEDEAAARRDLASDAWGNPYGDGAGIELTFTAERVLAECAAKRRIVELHQPLPGGEFCSTCDVATVGDSWPCATIRALASIWADHPDYRKEWA